MLKGRVTVGKAKCLSKASAEAYGICVCALRRASHSHEACVFKTMPNTQLSKLFAIKWSGSMSSSEKSRTGEPSPTKRFAGLGTAVSPAEGLLRSAQALMRNVLALSVPESGRSLGASTASSAVSCLNYGFRASPFVIEPKACQFELVNSAYATVRLCS